MKDKVWECLNKRVEVGAMGVKYSGIFKGADEDWVFLQCETTWVQIPWQEIISFKPEGGEDLAPELERERPAGYFKPQLKVIKSVAPEGQAKPAEEKEFKKEKPKDWEKDS